MPTMQQLRESREELIETVEALQKQADDENRQLTAEELETFDATMAEVEQIDANLERREKLLATSGRIRAESNVGETATELSGSQLDGGAKQSLSLPNTVTRVRNLKGFQTQEDAYLAGCWVLGNIYGKSRYAEIANRHGHALGVQSLAQTEGVNEKGGYLVPTVMEQAIVDLREEYGVFRQWAFSRPMSSDHHVLSRRSSGLTAYAVGENDTITTSDKTWSRVELTAKKIATLTRYSSEVAQDAVINMASDLAGEIAYAFSNWEDTAGFNGDGTSTHNGITGVTVKIDDGTHTASVVDAASGNTAVETLDLADFQKCVGTLPRYPGIRPVWFVHQTVWANAMERLALAQGGATAAEARMGGQFTFMGFPVVISQILDSTLGADTSVIKALFGDLSMAASMGTRRGVTVATSSDVYFTTDEIAIRGTERVAINVHELGDTSNAGPLLALKTAAS